MVLNNFLIPPREAGATRGVAEIPHTLHLTSEQISHGRASWANTVNLFPNGVVGSIRMVRSNPEMLKAFLKS